MSEKKKHPGGRPRQYKSPDEMDVVINQYFYDCDNNTVEVVTKSGQVVNVKKQKPYTIVGLALALDLTDEGFRKYAKQYPEFVGVITRAKQRVHEQWSTFLFDKEAGRGAQFALKHHYGWSDRQQFEGSISLEQILAETDK